MCSRSVCDYPMSNGCIQRPIGKLLEAPQSPTGPTVQSSIPECLVLSPSNSAKSQPLVAKESDRICQAMELLRLQPTATEEDFAAVAPSVWLRLPTAYSRARQLFHGNNVRRDGVELSFTSDQLDVENLMMSLDVTSERIGKLLENGGTSMTDKNVLCSMILTALGSVALSFCEYLTATQCSWKQKGLTLTWTPPTPTLSQATSPRRVVS